MITITLSPNEAAIFGKLLEEFHDNLGNNGCNDYSVPATEANLELWYKCEAANYRCSVEEVKLQLLKEGREPFIHDNKLYFADFVLMDYFKGLVQKAALS